MCSFWWQGENVCRYSYWYRKVVGSNPISPGHYHSNLRVNIVMSKKGSSYMWHDQGKWVTCRKFQFRFSDITFSRLQMLHFYANPITIGYLVDNAKNNMKQRNLTYSHMMFPNRRKICRKIAFVEFLRENQVNVYDKTKQILPVITVVYRKSLELLCT